MIFEYFNENLKGVTEFVSNKFPKDTKYKINIAIDNKLEYYAYDVYLEGETLYLRGYDIYALYNAADAVAYRIKNGEELSFSYRLPDREEYIKDPDKLYMRWIAEWQPDPRMLDFDRKIDAFENVSERLITCAHRADAYYYPENSLEGIISFYRMGGDVVELDVQVTKDGVIILMHDGDLKRMTNASDFVGKTVNGVDFPLTYRVTDWTYEQLQRLNLREKNGRNKDKTPSALTPFKVPSFVEVLKFCKGRLFIVTDKTKKWRYSDRDNLIMSPNVFLFDAMKEADNYNSILLWYGLDPKAAAAVQKQIYEHSGVKAYILTTDHGTRQSTFKMLSSLAMEKSFGVHAGPANPRIRIASQTGFVEWKEKIVLCGWTLNVDYDNREFWETMYKSGWRMIMANNYLELVRFASETVIFDK